MKDIIAQILFMSIKDMTGITKEQLLRKGIGSGERPLTFIRAIFFVIIYNEVEINTTELGELLNRDHSTVVFHKKMHAVRLEKFSEYRRLYNIIFQDFTSSKNVNLPILSLEEREKHLLEMIERMKAEVAQVQLKIEQRNEKKS